MTISKKEWILLALRKAPLDRIHLMKALFLVWKRSGKNIPEYFDFVPYLYGPCSFEVYSVLDNLLSQGLIIQPSHSPQRSIGYYLTKQGRIEAESVANTADLSKIEMLELVVEKVSQLGFHELLKEVYSEAPEFAVNSLVREVIRK